MSAVVRKGGTLMPMQRITHSSVVDALDSLLRSLAAYERKYNMTSADFYGKYLSGKMEDSADFVEWAGDYQHYVALKQELEQKLKVVA
jgi:hypothetical protein